MAEEEYRGMNMYNNANAAESKNIKRRNVSSFGLMATLCLVLAACAGAEKHAGLTQQGYNSADQSASIAPASGEEAVNEINDPLEKSNRTIFKFNNAIDHAVIHPIAKGYRKVAPQPVRTGLRNFLRNLKSPMTFANQLLQGDVEGAGEALVRTVVNSTVGLAGLIDVAAMHGLEYEQEDFGQTLGVWGVGHGPYVVVPILGPSSVRDYAGYFVDAYADPLRWWLFNTDNEGWFYAKVGADYLDLRESLVDVLEDLEKSSIDYYAAVRSTYYQRREALKNDETQTAIPDFEESE